MLSDRFELLARVGKGGMGEVYKARATGPHGFEKIVAVKRILPELAFEPEFEEKFLREARLSALLGHANVVQVFELTRTESGLCMVMEYITGGDLRRLLSGLESRGGSLPIDAALFIATEVCKGLEYAHGLPDGGLVHRDLSPSNIMLSVHGEVKITDFGVADVARRCKTGIVDVVGKWNYMAPEQARGRSVDGRSDLFSLGAVLYRSLAGVAPFIGDTPWECIRRAEGGLYQTPTVSTELWPESLDLVLRRLLAADANDRYPCARAVQDAFAEAAEDAGIRLDGWHMRDLVRELDSESAEEVRSQDTDWMTADGDAVTVLVRGANTTGDEIPSLEAVVAPRPGTLTVSETHRPTRWWLVGAGAAAVALLILIVGLVEWGSEPPAVETRAPERVTSTADGAPAVELNADTATVEFTSEPSGARVVVDGSDLGRTPLAASVEYGSHRFSVRKRGYRAVNDSLRVTGPSAVHRKLAPVGNGVLRLFSEPWAEVWIDGKNTGKTTPVELRLSIGRHRVKLVNPVRKLRKNVDVTIRADGAELVQVKLE